MGDTTGFRFLSLLFIVCPWTVFSGCVIYDDPRYLGLYVSCPGRDLSRIPDYFPHNTSSADLSRNFIAVVKNDSFIKTPYLKYLDLSHNLLTHLEVQAFHSCTLLRHLDISYNKLSLTRDSFPDTVFDPLINLRWLNMKHNQKGDGTYPDRIFFNLGKLEVFLIGAYKKQVFGSGFGRLLDLKELYIGNDDCDFSQILNNTFLHLTNASLDTLEISGCRTEIMEAGSLEPLGALKKLHLVMLHLGTKQTFAALAPLKGRRMEVIELNHIRLPDIELYPSAQNINDRTVQGSVLKHLSNVCVKTFVIRDNSLLLFDWLFLAYKRFGVCVEKIDASLNHFIGNQVNTMLGLISFSSLKELDLSVPDMASVRPDVKPKYTFESINLAVNQYPTKYSPCKFTTCKITIPANLTLINCSSITNTLGSVQWMVSFVNGKNIKHLNFSFLGVGDVDLKVTGLENLEVLDLTGNPDLNFITLDPFLHVSNLEELRLSYSFQQDAVNDKGTQLLEKLPNLKRLYLGYNQLYIFPKNIFYFNSKLEFIDLSGNLFTSIPFDLRLLPRLVVLDLTFNTVTTLTQKDRHVIDEYASNMSQLYLKYNLFSCGCDSLDFLLWLSETHAHLDNERNYACLKGSGGIGSASEILKNYPKLWRKCMGLSLFYITLFILTLLVACGLGALLVKTNKTSIIYMILNNLRKQLRRPGRADFRWDVYVAYAEADYQWICHCLCPRLEEKGIKLYIYDRDSVPGDSIPDQITENISHSWKTVLYFTDNYQRDQWSFVSMMAAINCVDNLNPERLILLLPEEEYPRIPNCLLEVVPESCIFFVANRLENQDQLWDDISRLIIK